MLALISCAAVIATACGGDDDGTTGTASPETTSTVVDTSPEEPRTTADDEAAAEDGTPVDQGDGVLRIGTLLPETGALSFLGPPQINAVRVALSDINAAGGVLGAEVELIEGDSGDVTDDVAGRTVNDLLAGGVDVIIGASSSDVTELVIDQIIGAGVIQFSPADTSPDFTDYPDDGLYFRTSPSDLLQARVLANLAVDEDNRTAAVLYRQGSYGDGLASAFRESFTEQGGTIPEGGLIAYAPDTATFDAEVDTIAALEPDAILVIGFEESARILATMEQKGVGPASGTNVYGVDANIEGIGSLVQDPSILAGMRGTIPSVDLAAITDFTDRLDSEGGVPSGGVTSYAAEAYDAVVITALAAEVAGTDRPRDVASEIVGVTRGGTSCTSYAECRELILAGEDIDYDGIGGPYEFSDAGEPTAAQYRIATYDGTYVSESNPSLPPGSQPNPVLDEYVFAS